MHQAPMYLLSGLTAEAVSGVIWTPMDVAKSRLQKGVEDASIGQSAVRILKGVWIRDGWRGVFRVGLNLGVLSRDGSDPRSDHRDTGCPLRFLGEPRSLPSAVILILGMLMAGSVPMLAYVSTHAHIHSSSTNSFLSDWAAYGTFKTAFIPGYSPSPCSEPIPIHRLLIRLS